MVGAMGGLVEEPPPPHATSMLQTARAQIEVKRMVIPPTIPRAIVIVLVSVALVG